MELRCDEVFPCEGENLAVHIVDGGRYEKHQHHPPSPVSHEFFSSSVHIGLEVKIVLCVVV